MRYEITDIESVIIDDVLCGYKCTLTFDNQSLPYFAKHGETDRLSIGILTAINNGNTSYTANNE